MGQEHEVYRTVTRIFSEKCSDSFKNTIGKNAFEYERICLLRRQDRSS